MKKSFYLSSLLVICFSLFSGAASAQAVVTTDPSNVTACAGSSTYFRIIATGATSYMWQVSADGGGSWDTVHNGTVYTTATTDTVRVNVSAALNTYKYRCIAFATAGNDTSNAATLTVDIPSAGTITGPDAVCIGSHISFTSSVAGGVWSNVFHTLDTITAAGIDTGRSAGMDTIKYAVTNTCGTTTSWKLLRVDNYPSALPITGPTAVCVANHITLNNANLLGTWTWSSNNTALATIGSNSGVVTGVAGGFDIISYSFTNACSTVVSTTTVHIETTLLSGTITGASSVCNGSWITLNNSVSGGIWLSGAGSVASVDGAGHVTGLSQGTSLISYYFANSCGSSFATHAVEVVVPAAPITGNDSVGIDSTIMLSNTTPDGTWSSSDISIATIGSTGMVTGHDTGTTVIVYDVTNACGVSSVSLTMNVGPLPYGGIISGPDSVCMGSTITLVDTTGYGPVVAWRSKYDTVGTISPAGLFTPVGIDSATHIGYDTVYATIRTAFGTTVVKRSVIVHTTPIITLNVPATIALGGSYSLSATPTGGTWSVSNPSVTALIGYGFIVVIAPGTSIITYTSTNSCGTRSAKDTVTLASGSSVNNVTGESASLNVFPNPSNGSVTINLAAGLNETAVVTITNVIGEKVKEFGVKSNVNTEVVLDEPAGVYLLNAVTASGIKYSTKINIAK